MCSDLPEARIRALIQLAFSEDLGTLGDITSLSTLHDSAKGSAGLILKDEGVIAGLPLLQPICNYIDPAIQITVHAEDGQSLSSMDLMAEFRGNLQSILICERTVLNFLQRLSGIATMTRKFVEAVSHTRTRILDTRKTTPGFRLLEKYAVRQGGGMNHRTGLFDMVLIKDNHIDANGGVGKAISRCVEYLERSKLSVPIEVETRNFEEVKEAVRFPVQRIMLDNMTPGQMAEAVRFIDGRAETEASGNIGIETVGEVAETGVDFISVGALTHSVQSLDMTMRVDSRA